MDSADEVEVPHIERAIRTAGQCHWGKQHHVLSSTTAAWTTGDAAIKTIPHHSADDRRLLGEEDVLPISFVKDSCTGTNNNKSYVVKTYYTV